MKISEMRNGILPGVFSDLVHSSEIPHDNKADMKMDNKSKRKQYNPNRKKFSNFFDVQHDYSDYNDYDEDDHSHDGTDLDLDLEIDGEYDDEEFAWDDPDNPNLQRFLSVERNYDHNNQEFDDLDYEEDYIDFSFDDLDYEEEPKELNFNDEYVDLSSDYYNRENDDEDFEYEDDDKFEYDNEYNTADFNDVGDDDFDMDGVSDIDNELDYAHDDSMDHEDIEPDFQMDGEDYDEDPFDSAAAALLKDYDNEYDQSPTGYITKWWRENSVKKVDGEYVENEEDVGGPPAIDRARPIFLQSIAKPGITRAEIIEQMVKQLGITDSSAISYYQRLAKEFNYHPDDNEESNDNNIGQMDDIEQNDQELDDPINMELDDEMDDELSDENPEVQEWENPDRAGLIRVVDNAHLVYKRQDEDGTFSEMWIYNVDNLNDELKIRRDILAGTDIPQNRTRSEDDKQRYKISTMGNAQIITISGLSN